MSSKKRRAADSNGSITKRAANVNYYQPLQTLNDDERTYVTEVPTQPKIHIPPITILKCSTDVLHKFCKEIRIIKYSIRKISIGYKLFCENQYDYDNAIKQLKEKNMEFFSYTSKNNRPYKVVLSGLDKIEPEKVKTGLLKLGLKCLEVKIVCRKFDNNRETIFYIVYLRKGSTNITELRNNIKSINYIRIKWSYQSKIPNKVTQCYNCQMFGHGAYNCNIKTFCSNCAGDHETSKRTSSIVKCANCRGDHKSTSKDCPSRVSFVYLKERYSKQTYSYNTRKPFENVPNVIANQNITSSSDSYANVVRSNSTTPNTSNDLFSFNELKMLTLELIENLKSCKSKSDQFSVITNLDFKFLS